MSRSCNVDATVACPYCGEENAIVVDPSAGSTQQYVEDCQVCCKPWQVTVTSDDGDVQVDLRPMAE